MRKNLIDYFYFMNSQVIFLMIFTIILLFFDSFSWFYGVIFIIYAIFFTIPIIHLVYMVKNTNKTSFFIKEKSLREFNSRKYLWYLLLFFIPFIINNFVILSKFVLTHIDFYYFPYIILFVLTLHFIFKNEHYDYWILENILFVNILKFKIIEIKNKEGNKKIIFTRKDMKKFQKINIKHITRGLYYY